MLVEVVDVSVRFDASAVIACCLRRAPASEHRGLTQAEPGVPETRMEAATGPDGCRTRHGGTQVQESDVAARKT